MMGISSAFPVLYQMRACEQTVQQLIIVNWLNLEAMSPAVIRQHKVLKTIVGWRTRECYEAIRGFDWTKSMYVEMNGPGALS